MNQLVPGLRVDRFGGSTQPTLRGIGVQNVLGPGFNAQVATYIDGIHQTGLDGSIFDFADLTGVQVLKGPQGTLFGANASAGAIVLTTADPAFETSGRAAVTYGSFHDRRVQLYGTTAISDTLAINLSLYHRDSDNYLTDIVTGQPSAPVTDTTVRSKLLYKPHDGLRFVLSGSYHAANDPSSVALQVRQPVANFYRDAFAVPLVQTQTPYQTSLGQRTAASPQSWSLSLTGEAELGFATLVSRTGLRAERGRVRSDLDGTTLHYFYTDYLQRDQTLSQEFNLIGHTSGPLQWQAGFYYANNLGSLLNRNTQDIFSTGIPTDLFGTRIRVASDSVALFGNVTYQIAPDWLATAGLRLSHERKSMRSQGLVAPFPAFADSRGWDDASPRLSLRHILDAQSSIFIAATRGFMPGNYNYLGFGPQSAVKPERVTQYEAGYQQAGESWSLDASTYLTDYRNLQAYTYVSACGCFHFSNVPKADVWGAEANGQVAITDTVTLRAGLAYTRARYSAFTGESPTGAPFLPPIYGYQTGPTNFTGSAMIRSPDWSGTIGASWSLPTQHGTWGAAANLYLTSTVPFTPDRQLTEPGYGLLNLTASWLSPDEGWKVTATGENVTDRLYKTFSAQGFLGHSIAYGAPAAWRLQLARTF